MKFLTTTLLLLSALFFSACADKHHGYSHHYYSNHPVVYEYVPLTPLVSPSNVIHVREE